MSCQVGFEYDPLVRTCVKVDCGFDKIYIEEQQICVCINKTLKYVVNGVCSLCNVGQY